MNQLSEKELSALNDLLSEEELLVKKYNMLAGQCEDAMTKSSLQDIAEKHQGHFNALYAKLS